MIEPKYKEDTENLKKSQEGFIEWINTVNSGEKIKLGLKFSIEFAREIEVAGLE